METLADIVAAGRDREGTVVDAPDRTADYTYHEFATNAWKAGNLLRHYGVRPGATLAVVVGPKEPSDEDEPGTLGAAADPLLAILGGAVTGAVVDLTPAEPVDARAVVLPDNWVDRYELAPGCSAVAYGGPPEASGVAHFERELWSENPIEPPEPIAPDDDALRVDGTTYTHGELVDATKRVVEEQGLEAGDVVALTAPLSTVGAVVAGVLAPLSVGATVRLGSDDGSARYVVDEATGEKSVDPATVI
jgi:hypothetical protein